MASNNRVLRGDTTIWLAYPEALSDWSDISAADFNAAVTAGLIVDVSCATEDSYTMNQTDSATDDSLSVCDTGNVSIPTFYNYEVSLPFFRDEDSTADGVYNAAWNMTRVKGLDYVTVKRLNKPQGTAVAEDDILYAYVVKTDNPTTTYERGAAVQHVVPFKPQGLLYSGIEATA